MAILALNVGSSSLKATLFDLKLKRLRDGEIKDLHQEVSEIEVDGVSKKCRIGNLGNAFALLMKAMEIGELNGIGHRFIHGGPKYAKSVLIDEKVLRDLETLKHLAPLHNPECLAVIQASKKLFLEVPQVAVFDTAFHRTLPPHAATYGIPRHLSEKYHVERYGFHGISHAYMASRIRKKKLITLHLGNGCSGAAILNGKSIDTSMGFSPAEGLLMGTRAGDIDFTILEYLHKVTGQSLKQITHMLNFESGLLGVSGKTSDVKTLLSNKDPHSRLAIDLFCHRIVKTVGAYTALLGGMDAIAFSGGIGENSAEIRDKVCSSFGYLGLRLSSQKNRATIHLSPGDKRAIHSPTSAIEIYAIGADEDSFIAQETLRIKR